MTAEPGPAHVDLEVTGPDADGAVWLVLTYPNGDKRFVNLGTAEKAEEASILTMASTKRLSGEGLAEDPRKEAAARSVQGFSVQRQTLTIDVVHSRRTLIGFV